MFLLLSRSYLLAGYPKLRIPLTLSLRPINGIIGICGMLRSNALEVCNFLTLGFVCLCEAIFLAISTANRGAPPVRTEKGS